MLNLLCIMFGGGLGAVVRGAITNYCNRHFVSRIPIATLFVNLVGSLLIGIIMNQTSDNLILSLTTVGFLGGLTTFSTLASELVQFIDKERNLFHFILYSVLQYLGAFIACLIGYTIS